MIFHHFMYDICVAYLYNVVHTIIYLLSMKESMMVVSNSTGSRLECKLECVYKIDKNIEINVLLLDVSSDSNLH